MPEDIDIAALCNALGIDALGVVSAGPMRSFDMYRQIIGRGLPPQLDYLWRNADCRRDLEAILPGTKSVVCCAVALPAFRGDASRRYARFCTLGDYHQTLRVKLQGLDACLRAHFPIAQSRICVDSAPVLERELAVRAGLGDIGFNRIVSHPELGSFIVLAELLVDTDLTEYREKLSFRANPEPAEGAPGARACCPPGHRACVRACPVGALTEDGYDLNRCLAYWTTQHKGDIPEPYAAAMGDMIWGCDRCQKACPRNRNAVPAAAQASPLETLSFDDILTLSARQLRKRLADTPLADGNPNLLVRNVCIAIGNMGDSKYAVRLGNIARSHACDWVRRAAERALKIIGDQ
ncbi:MAG: DUF1730 domain-containing protein [Proteobacteria bacterium]|nr:DUF1730 domain-containing protein [Pseudomonadota bacterium]